ncbi:DUF6301 family protein [Nocardia sp. alder85J]|uniref:DUF6301 family protein n=1 Tax=Nocardia sp. alder85J TaxID=2862949 RepID=UPI001CD46ED3|nr:DUF6301 family protein [Nocardia sp. alder85J]MCX4093054.1 DUF6301 family protein [Nocardia sp. alder85J]
MTEWRALDHAEITQWATGLLSFTWSWRTAEVPELVAAFGWQVLLTRPSRVLFDTGFGLSSGLAFGLEEGRVDHIELEVSDTADDDASGHALVQDAFASMAAALTRAFGEPTQRRPGKYAEIRWAGAETTLLLERLPSLLLLRLARNAYLASQDRIDELDKQGLL